MKGDSAEPTLDSMNDVLSPLVLTSVGSSSEPKRLLDWKELLIVILPIMANVTASH